MAIKYINIFHPKALRNLPKLVFLFENKPSGNPAMWVDEEKKTFSFSLEKALLFKDRFPANKF
jgi:hypothetical protein